MFLDRGGTSLLVDAQFLSDVCARSSSADNWHTQTLLKDLGDSRGCGYEGGKGGVAAEQRSKRK
jgi:hypothetical protein